VTDTAPDPPSTPPSDPERHKTLVELTTRGDEPALSELLVEHVQQIEAFVRRRAHRLPLASESVSDLVQSVCREALEDLRNGKFEYRGRARFVGWLHRVTLSKMIDRHRRRQAVRDKMKRMDKVTPGDVASHLMSPSECLQAEEERLLLARAFDRLPDNYQEIIWLARFLELPHKEIGKQLGLSVDASRALLSRAIARLALLMRSLEKEGSG